jgi:hypothetical protein
MKNKLVVWGTNAENEKVLIALELQPETNKVLLYTFPESVASDEFVNKMMNEWRTGGELAFPEGYARSERELSVVESLLPDDLKVERGDLLHRAQTEWQFAVLSSKLHQAYQQELAEFKDKVQGLQSYDHTLWESLRAFWDKVQGQSRDRNLFREHADHLRDNINALFDDLKKMRSRVQDEFMSTSSKVYDEFSKALDDIEGRIAAGGNKLNSVFEDLKQMQRRYRDARMSNEHRNSLWERLDGAFKAAKERKFGPSANEGSVVERHSRRLEGLNEAIRRMEDSIRRDEEELNFQRRKIDASEGQLEAQIRTAKIKMIEERVGSKREKLQEMNQTRTEVERQAQIAKGKEAKRAEKEADRQRIEAAKEAAKSEIAAGMKGKTAPPPRPAAATPETPALAAEPAVNYGEAPREEPETTEPILPAEPAETPVAAPTEPAQAELAELGEPEEITKAEEPAEEAPESGESVLGTIGGLLGESLEDAVTTVRAVASVMADRAEDFLENARDKGEILAENAREKGKAMLETAKEKGQAIAETVREKGEAMLETAMEKGEALVDNVREKSDAVLENAAEEGDALAEAPMPPSEDVPADDAENETVGSERVNLNGISAEDKKES